MSSGKLFQRKKTLRRTLLLGPSTILLTSFLIILVIFNFSIQTFIKMNVSKRLDLEMKMCEDIFNSNDGAVLEIKEIDDISVVVPVEYVILDENYKVVSAIDTQLDPHHIKNMDIVGNKIRKNPELLKQKNMTIDFNDRRFVGKSKVFYGKLDDIFIVKASPGELSKPYTLVIFAEVTMMRRYILLVRNVLIGLMSLQGLIAIFLFYRMAGRIDNGFRSVKIYLESVGLKKPVDVDESSQSFVEFSQVIDTAKNMKQLIERSELAQIEFFQNTSHALRTPLMSIQGYAEGLKAGVVKDQDYALDVITNETEKISELIDKMNMISQMTTEKLDFQVYSLADLVEEWAENAEGMAISRGITMKIKKDPDVFVELDKNKMNIAVTNIITNGIRYAKSYVEIGWEVADGKVRIHISNDGVEIPAEIQPLIFKRFYKGEGGNTGIGLAVSKSVVEVHRGSIKVKSDPEITEFIVDLPQFCRS
ncbi:MAG: HAMP domain-containing sensor histidine kinase [Clostridiales bacterium]|nr:HAMP domain-containing histidine kinase [Clostridiales bacterium]MDD7347824.1 HAMP domain-containing sensor histidine kinase [Clostridiales bacterium]MDY4060738.1 HAMP domain-containing sensor histidine kinase [Anaerovoracaceae bacterium]